jgi:hypothetical protein
MADWKQITARIRRARGSKDPAGQLTLLFEKTKDAMVAFELGRHFEIARNPAQALEWYQNAYSRFRRGDWKSKCGEAITRLGGELPVDLAQKSSSEVPAASIAVAVTAPEPALPFEQNATAFESLVAVGSENPPSDTPSTATTEAEKKRRRRGRRGGRNRSKKPSAPQTSDSPAHSPRETSHPS